MFKELEQIVCVYDTKKSYQQKIHPCNRYLSHKDESGFGKVGILLVRNPVKPFKQ